MEVILDEVQLYLDKAKCGNKSAVNGGKHGTNCRVEREVNTGNTRNVGEASKIKTGQTRNSNVKCPVNACSGLTDCDGPTTEEIRAVEANESSGNTLSGAVSGGRAAEPAAYG
ncbi:aluminium activated malate transporter family protein [Striga asiatica]|uniref:Aluminium activated malate transporter family protein n=1 Tax=Striga asiatica TaxID=4170 RepID=A0A5A7R3H6_STRAF|nr:aluminium activated malate transporter family protein [Striga asiatica]